MPIEYEASGNAPEWNQSTDTLKIEELMASHPRLCLKNLKLLVPRNTPRALRIHNSPIGDQQPRLEVISNKLRRATISDTLMTVRKVTFLR
jgi:hypothetical protein